MDEKVVKKVKGKGQRKEKREYKEVEARIK